MADLMQQARELLAAEFAKDWQRGNCRMIADAILNGDELRGYGIPYALAAIAAALRAAPEWQPIDTAPEGRLVVVGWLDSEDSHYPENYEFDYLEDGLWVKHEDCVEHADAVAPPGSKLPKEQPPYQWWMDLPAFPAARPQGVNNG